MAAKKKDPEIVAGLEKIQEILDKLETMCKAVRDTGVSDDALYLLIQASAGNVGGRKISLKVIKAVFEGVENLYEFVFPEEETP